MTNLPQGYREMAEKLFEEIMLKDNDCLEPKIIEQALLQVRREALSECKEVLKKCHHPQATERAYWINDVLNDVEQQIEDLAAPGEDEK